MVGRKEEVGEGGELIFIGNIMYHQGMADRWGGYMADRWGGCYY